MAPSDVAAAVKKSKWNELQANLGYEVAPVKLDRVAGVPVHE